MPYIEIAFFSVFIIYFILKNRASNTEHLQQGKEKQIVQKAALLQNMAVYSCVMGILVGVSVFYVNVFYRFMYDLFPFVVLAFPNLVTSTSIQLNKHIKIAQTLCVITVVVLFIAFLFVPKGWFGIDPYTLYKNT